MNLGNPKLIRLNVIEKAMQSDWIKIDQMRTNHFRMDGWYSFE